MADNLTYQQSTGIMSLGSVVVSRGWAGNDCYPGVNDNHIHGKNNPDAQNIHSIGPLPQGWYTLSGFTDPEFGEQPVWGHHHRLGQMVAFLQPDADNEMFGRAGFYIHGPSMNPDLYGQESEGCVVQPHDQRQATKDTGVLRLQVIA
jgi:hypothetical protein